MTTAYKTKRLQYLFLILKVKYKEYDLSTIDGVETNTGKYKIQGMGADYFQLEPVDENGELMNLVKKSDLVEMGISEESITDGKVVDVKYYSVFKDEARSKTQPITVTESK